MGDQKNEGDRVIEKKSRSEGHRHGSKVDKKNECGGISNKGEEING